MLAGSRGTSDSRERLRTRNVLVVAQVALALVLLVSSGLMIRTFLALRGVVPGFDTESRADDRDRDSNIGRGDAGSDRTDTQGTAGGTWRRFRASRRSR